MILALRHKVNIHIVRRLIVWHHTIIMDTRRGHFFSRSLILLTLFVLGCAPFRDSPFSDNLLSGAHNLNAANLGALDIDTKQTLRIAVLSDPHQNYKELDNTIDDINRTAGIDFVVNLGDFTNQGYNLEYDRFIPSHERIKKPAFVVIGNHDSIGAGRSLFKKAFGALNYVIDTQYYRFVFFNSNNLELPDDFDPEWLEEQVTSSTLPVYIFTHVNLRDPERFKGEDKEIFERVLTHANTKLVMNGHNHVFNLMRRNTLYSADQIEVPRVEGKNWLLIEIGPADMKMQKAVGQQFQEFAL